MSTPIQLIDTHIHLYDEAFRADLDQVMRRSQRSGVKKLYMPNLNAESIAPMLALEAQHPARVRSMVGLHPCYVNEHFEQELYAIEEVLQKHPFVAVGEVGMDLHRSTAHRDRQQAAFDVQVKWAKRHRLPLSLHCREAFTPAVRTLEKHQDGSLTGVFHCFGGRLKEAHQIMDLGFVIGIGGIVTFKNAALPGVVRYIPLEYLVLETDGPYLAPSPHRGTRNEPAYLVAVAERLAEIKQISFGDVAAVTTENALRIFEKNP